MTSTKAKKQAPRHKEGSRKAKVRDLFDAQGPEAAWTLGLKLKLAQSTLRSWFATWRRESQPVKKKKATTRPATKPIKTAITTPPEPVESIPAFLQG